MNREITRQDVELWAENYREAIDTLMWFIDKNYTKEDMIESIQNLSESTTLLECPKCSHISKVYHLDWYAVVCEGCSEEVKLTEFKEIEEEM
jgi:ribosomal protein S27E